MISQIYRCLKEESAPQRADIVSQKSFGAPVCMYVYVYVCVYAGVSEIQRADVVSQGFGVPVCMYVCMYTYVYSALDPVR